MLIKTALVKHRIDGYVGVRDEKCFNCGRRNPDYLKFCGWQTAFILVTGSLGHAETADEGDRVELWLIPINGA